MNFETNTLKNKREDYQNSDKILQELSTIQKPKRTMVPIFGGAALIPALIQPLNDPQKNDVLAWLGGESFVRCNVVEARKLISLRSSDLDTSLSAISQKLEELHLKQKEQEPEQEPEQTQTEEDQNVVEIREPIVGEMETKPDENQKAKQKQNEAVQTSSTTTTTTTTTDSTSAMNEFFERMTKGEEEWKREIERREEFGDDIDDEIEEQIALQITSSIAPPLQTPTITQQKKEQPIQSVQQQQTTQQQQRPQSETQTPNFVPNVSHSARAAATNSVMTEEIQERETPIEVGAPSQIAPFVELGQPDIYERDNENDSDNESEGEEMPMIQPSVGKASSKGPPTVRKSSRFSAERGRR